MFILPRSPCAGLTFPRRRLVCLLQVLYHIGMLKLFLPLLLGKKKAGGAKPSADNVARTPAQKDSIKAE